MTTRIAQHIQFNAAPAHQAVYYAADLYDPRLTICSMNHLVHILAHRNKYSSTDGRLWFQREVARSGVRMHPAIAMAMVLAVPNDWQNMVLEWPHVAVGDKTRIAYTRDEKSGEADRQTVTSIGKYLKRHFSTLPDHEIRNIGACFVEDSFKLVHTTEEMVGMALTGPKTCMSEDRFTPDDHPYRAYDPKYGWHMAVRMEGSVSMGRALCMVDGDDKFFVRSFRRVEVGYSQRDEALEAWMGTQGYERRDGWAGCEMEYIPLGDEFVAPYLDGCDQHVTVERRNGVRFLMIAEEGDYKCDTTDGRPEEAEEEHICEYCDDPVDEDDMHPTGYHGETYACGYCIREHHTEVIGRRQETYFVTHGNAVYVESQDQSYDIDHLSSNDIVELAEGGYGHEEDCVRVSRENEWHLEGSHSVVHCEHSQTYELREDCVEVGDGDWAHKDDVWQCAHSDVWYLAENAADEQRQVEGHFVHVDYVDDFFAALTKEVA